MITAGSRLWCCADSDDHRLKAIQQSLMINGAEKEFEPDDLCVP